MVAFGLVACNHKGEIQEKSDYKVSQDTIIIDDNSPIIEKLETMLVTSKPYSNELTTSGTVKAIPNNFAYIVAPFAGRITKSFVRLGQEVKAGAPIFEIISQTYFETGKSYYQAKEEMYLTLKNLKRQKDLLSKGVGIQKDVEEAEVNYAIKKKDFENAIASLKVFQVDTADFVLGQPLIIRSPIKGTIVENNIVIGAYIKEDSEPVATVAELSKIWVAGQVKEKDIRYITENMNVKISLCSFPDETIDGQIYHISSLIDENTRSVEVFIECDNVKKIMKPGMYVTVHFINEKEDAILIPTKAIFQMHDVSYTFIHLGKNKYIRREVDIMKSVGDSTIIKSGLLPNEEIITNGGIYLMEAE